MVLAQGRYWRATIPKGSHQIVLGLQRESLPEELRELREFKIVVPLENWNRVVKQVNVDRKLLGGILLDFAQHKGHVSMAVGDDRLFTELQHVVASTTTAAIECGALAVTVVDVGADG